MDLLSSLRELRRMSANTELELSIELHTMIDDLSSDMSVREVPPQIDNDISCINIKSVAKEPDLNMQVLKMKEFNEQMRQLVTDKVSRFKEANAHKISQSSSIFGDIYDMKQTMRNIKRDVRISDTNIQIIQCINDIDELKDQIRQLDNQISMLNYNSKYNKLQVEKIKDTVVNSNHHSAKHNSMCQIF